MAVVLIFKIEDQTFEIPLLSKIIVGRSTSCDLTLPDKQMSGKHGAFELNAKGELFYTDLGSTNGSYLNNSQIHKSIFKLNDTVLIGNTTVKIDEKKLNSKERLAIGRTPIQDGDQTLMVGTLSRTNAVVSGSDPIHEDEKPKEKKSVVLNKNLKNKRSTAPSDAWSSRKNEKTIEQEETGKTKFLKLDKGMGLGKKKK